MISKKLTSSSIYRYRVLILAIILVVLYLVVRIINLTIIPVFVDEAIYTRWTQIIASDPNYFFIPLSDGKQPLFMWLASLPIRLPIDPLVATRMVSVLAGLAIGIGTWLIARKLFSQRTAFISAILIITCPFLLLYNRLAVPDGLLSAFFIFTILFSLRLVKKLSYKDSILLGIILGGGLLTKTTAGIFILLLPVSLLFFPWKKGHNIKNLIKLAIYWAISLVIAYLLYSILRISPLYYLIKQRTPDFIFTPKEILQHPFDPLFPRIADVAGWIIGYLTIPVALLLIAGVIIMIYRHRKAGLFLLAWFIIPLAIEMEIAKGFTPRYFIFIAPIGLLFVAYIMNIFLSFKNWYYLRILACLLVLIPACLFDFYLLTNPEKAPIPAKEKDGYLEEWSAGYGVFQMSTYLKQVAKSGVPITVGTEGTQGYGTVPDGLQIYVRNTPNITVVGMGQPALINTVPANLISDSSIHPAYLVVNQDRFSDTQNPHLKLISSYPKANGKNPLLLYKIIP